MIWIILAAIAAFLFWYLAVRPMSHFTRLGVKQSDPWPIFGDQWKTILRQMSFYELIEFAYNIDPNGRYCGFYQSAIPTLVIRDPDLLKQITVKDFDHFTDHRPFVDPDSEPLWGGNLFLLRGQRWREMRATLSGSFTTSKMKTMFSLMNETAENFVQFFLNKNQDIVEAELKDSYCRYTNDVIASAAFGIKVDSLSDPNNVFYLMGKEATDMSKITIRLKFFGYMVVPWLFKAFKIRFFSQNVEIFFKNLINDTIKMREENGIVRKDMINLLLEARKGIKQNEDENINVETGFATAKESKYSAKFRQLKSLTNDDIAAQAIIFFFAGFDSISTAMCFGSYELAINKEIQDKLRKEIVETHRINDGKLTYETLLKMRYMDMVLSEILRKWPAGAGVDRVVTQPYTIQPVKPNEKPYHLKVGDVLFYSIIGLHRDPEHFPEPEKFDPERFSEENVVSIKPYTYVPFGVGPRNCIGSRFAMLEIKALLYHLLLNFEIVPSKKMRVPLKLSTKSINPAPVDGWWFELRRI